MNLPMIVPMLLVSLFTQAVSVPARADEDESPFSLQDWSESLMTYMETAQTGGLELSDEQDILTLDLLGIPQTLDGAPKLTLTQDASEQMGNNIVSDLISQGPDVHNTVLRTLGTMFVANPSQRPLITDLRKALSKHTQEERDERSQDYWERSAIHGFGGAWIALVWATVAYNGARMVGWNGFKMLRNAVPKVLERVRAANLAVDRQGVVAAVKQVTREAARDAKAAGLAKLSSIENTAVNTGKAILHPIDTVTVGTKKFVGSLAARARAGRVLGLRFIQTRSAADFSRLIGGDPSRVLIAGTAGALGYTAFHLWVRQDEKDSPDEVFRNYEALALQLLMWDAREVLNEVQSIEKPSDDQKALIARRIDILQTQSDVLLECDSFWKEGMDNPLYKDEQKFKLEDNEMLWAESERAEFKMPEMDAIIGNNLVNESLHEARLHLAGLKTEGEK